jgi:hypothetical protein
MNGWFLMPPDVCVCVWKFPDLWPPMQRPILLTSVIVQQRQHVAHCFLWTMVGWSSHSQSFIFRSMVIPIHSLIWMGMKFRTHSQVFYSKTVRSPVFLHMLSLSCKFHICCQQQLLPPKRLYCCNTSQCLFNSEFMIFYFLHQIIIIIIIVIRQTQLLWLFCNLHPVGVKWVNSRAGMTYTWQKVKLCFPC